MVKYIQTTVWLTGLVTHESEVNSALNCRPRFFVIRDVDRDDAILAGIGSVVDVPLNNKIGGVQKNAGGKAMQQKQLLAGVDVGCHKHHVAIGGPAGIVEQFEISHDPRGFTYFFARVAEQARRHKLPVVVGMEGTNGYARPPDQMVKALLNVNNLKLARFKEIFATPSKKDSIDAQQIVTLMMMAPPMKQAKESLQQVPVIGEIEMQLKRISRCG